ncbi:MAG: MFS transporter [Pseudomonadales bacterium]|nr:MFS transporter [Pseudomonadales bacterium]
MILFPLTVFRREKMWGRRKSHICVTIPFQRVFPVGLAYLLGIQILSEFEAAKVGLETAEADGMNGLDRNVTVMMVFKVTITLFFFVPVMTLFWQENGLSLLEVMVLQSIFSIATVLMEFPSGVLADRYGRRRVLIAASLMSLVGLTIYSVADGFYSFLVAELLLAVWIALMSGADSALLYDSLKELKREDEYTQIWGNIQFYSLVFLAGVNILGGIIATQGLRYTLYASLPFSLIAFLSSFYFVEAGRESSSGSVRQQLSEVGSVFSLKSQLLWIVVYGGVVFAFNQGGLWIYQPYFRLTGIEIVYFGVIFAAFHVVAAVAGKYTWWLESYLGANRLLAVLLVLTAGASILMGLHLAIYSFAFVFVHQVVRGIFRILISNEINRRVDTAIRASVLSVHALSGRIVYALLIPVVGWLADVYTLEDAFTILGITGLFAGIPALLMLKRVGVI